ncbi:RsbRD N-terminal domain-containing protein [Lysobacter sp. HA18]
MIAEGTLAVLAAELEQRRQTILEHWRERLHNDNTLSTSDWTRKQLYDHFPDVLEAFFRILKSWPQPAVTAESDQFHYAHAHAKTRWLQGYSLRDVIREWTHFNAAVVLELANARMKRATAEADGFIKAEMLWADLAGEQLCESALEFQRLHQAEAATRLQELGDVLDKFRQLSVERAHGLGRAVTGLRGNLSTVMTSSTLLEGAQTDAERAELYALARESVSALDRSLNDMVLLARLEAGVEKCDAAPVDMGSALMLLVAGMAPHAELSGSQLTWDGPEPYVVEADAAKVRLLVRHLMLSGLMSESVGPIDVEWSDDRRDTRRWVIVVRQHVGHFPSDGTPAITQAIADATDRAQQAAGIAPTGCERALIEGRIPVASRDGVSLLLAKHLAELLEASLELVADEGIVTFRVSLPREYG